MMPLLLLVVRHTESSSGGSHELHCRASGCLPCPWRMDKEAGARPALGGERNVKDVRYHQRPAYETPGTRPDQAGKEMDCRALLRAPLSLRYMAQALRWTWLACRACLAKHMALLHDLDASERYVFYGEEPVSHAPRFVTLQDLQDQQQLLDIVGMAFVGPDLPVRDVGIHIMVLDDVWMLLDTGTLSDTGTLRTAPPGPRTPSQISKGSGDTPLRLSIS